jgi:hypothetical protein
VYSSIDDPLRRRPAPSRASVTQGVQAMSKEKNRGGKEARKPKKEKPKTNASAPSTKWNPNKPT